MSSTDSQLGRTNLQDELQDRVKRYIIENNHRPGDLLPPEAQLARLLGVSRASLREAMRVLQTIGVVESRHGSGTFVGSFSMDPLLEGMTFSIRTSSHANALQAMREILEVRTVLECHLIRRVAADISGQQLEQLDQIIGQMSARADRGESFPVEDLAFHEAMYRSSHNSFIVQLVRTFWHLFAQVEGNLRSIDDELHSVVEMHQHILDALHDHNPDAAEFAMIQHLDGIQERVNHASWHTE